ncbi:MAG: hypothetical protein CM1200mP12_04530 [Gammaproteobacteria bacterium]|nr:MAG: hypothetical protein CM1200mP12_04530 [Gammaproteobacteria bacterium]
MSEEEGVRVVMIVGSDSFVEYILGTNGKTLLIW